MIWVWVSLVGGLALCLLVIANDHRIGRQTRREEEQLELAEAEAAENAKPHGSVYVLRPENDDDEKGAA